MRPLGSEPQKQYALLQLTIVARASSRRQAPAAFNRHLDLRRQLAKDSQVFESISPAPDDPILGLTDAFQRDPNPAKVNLSVGIYQDGEGRTPILDSVKRAEEQLLRTETNKGYVGIAGTPLFAQCMQQLLLADLPEVVASGRAATSHTPGGTGALRIAGDFLYTQFPKAQVWISKPTWPNHDGIFKAAGLAVRHYPYFDPATNNIALDPMLAALAEAQPGDVVVLHGCCHNPTGLDPSPAQWQQIAETLRGRKLLPLVDFAYQGFATGLREDALAIQTLCQPDSELLICSSLSKNFGLYSERVGALTLIGRNRQEVSQAQTQVKASIRVCYSNPPSHGAGIATTILQSPELRSQWERELTGMRERMTDMRQLLVDTLRAKGVTRDLSFITRQRGMFSFSGLTPEEVSVLRDQHSIYIVSSGRINVAGLTRGNMDRVCEALAKLWR